MQRLSPRIVRPPNLDTRAVVIAVAVAALLLLAASAFYLNQFRAQRWESERNRSRLTGWQAQLLTATPAAQAREQLATQLALAQERFAQASGLLPGTNVEVAVLQRISEAAERSGVDLTTVQELGEPFQEGALVGWQYEVAASGDLARLTDFIARVEEEAFPAAYFSDDALLTERSPGEYLLAGTLTVYGSTLSTGSLGQPTALPGDLGAQLRAQAAEALALRDYELALSLLLQLAALEPNAPDVERLLYDTHVAYGNDLLARRLSDLAQEQCDAALAINPNGPEAVACLLAIAQQQTPTSGPIVVNPTATQGSVPPTPVVQPSPTALSVPPTLPPTVAPPPSRTQAPAPTERPEPTVTPFPSATTDPKETPTVTGTPPTLTPTVTGTPPTETPTITGTPPTATPTVTGTPPSSTPTGGTPNPYPFGALSPFYLPNCGLTQIKGTIRDSRTNAPLNDVTVRVWYDGAPDNEFYSLPSGRDPTRGAGEWDVVLNNHPVAGQWYVQIVDRTTGVPYSPRLTVYTDTNDCTSGGAGHQVVIQDFVKYGEGPGAPGATSTATRSPVPSTTPSPSVTPSLTPTISPTPTPTPLRYVKDENPNRDIPDGPDGEIESTIDVGDNVPIRAFRVFLNITHADVSDLEVNIVHPDGTSIMLHSQGQDAGATSIRRWFEVTGNDLARIRGKSAQGRWILEVIDRVEARTGQLLSWEMEVYP